MNENQSRIACYCRVSSQSQRTDSQRTALVDWLTASDIDPASVSWFEDRETGKSLARPSFANLQKEIFGGRIRTVVVWKLDRLSRRQRDGINLLADWCERGIRVVSVTQQIDLSGSVGRLIASVMFGVAEMELEFRRDRQAAGIAAARRRGVYCGRRTGTLKANPERAQQLRGRGLSICEIAQALAVSERTVHRYLG